MIYTIDGTELDLSVRDGMLAVARPDGRQIGSVLIADLEPPPDPAEEIATPEDIAPADPVLPDGWEMSDTGDVVKPDGTSIYGTTPTGQE